MMSATDSAIMDKEGRVVIARQTANNIDFIHHSVRADIVCRSVLTITLDHDCQVVFRSDMGRERGAPEERWQCYSN